MLEQGLNHHSMVGYLWSKRMKQCPVGTVQDLDQCQRGHPYCSLQFVPQSYYESWEDLEMSTVKLKTVYESYTLHDILNPMIYKALCHKIIIVTYGKS